MGFLGFMNSQVGLLVIDKLLIGAILLLVGYQVSKMLERYKSGQAFSDEFQKQKVVRLTAVCDSLAEFEIMVLHSPYRFSDILVREMRKHGIENVPELGQSISFDEARDIIIMAFQKLGKEAVDAVVKKDFMPYVDSLNKIVESSSVLMGKNRFWIDEQIYVMLRSYHGKLSSYNKDIYCLEDDAKERYERARDELSSSRDEIKNAINAAMDGGVKMKALARETLDSKRGWKWWPSSK
ncbi:hypothetical protein [Aeromonas sp. Marseille-Q7275]